MSQLHQIQVQYLPVEDRALLRITTDDAREFRFMVTRRYARLLLRALGDNLAAGPMARTRTAPLERREVLAFEREAALERADFDTRFDDRAEQMPLGERPVLLARLALRRIDSKVTLLALHPQTGTGIEVRLNDTMIHSLIKLMEEAGRKGEWALPQAIAPGVESGTRGPLN